MKDDTEIINRWSEYCKDLYNYQITPDRNLLNNRKSYSEIIPPIIKSEVEQAIRSIQKGKAAGVDNIPGELFTHAVCVARWRRNDDCYDKSMPTNLVDT